MKNGHLSLSVSTIEKISLVVPTLSLYFSFDKPSQRSPSTSEENSLNKIQHQDLNSEKDTISSNLLFGGTYPMQKKIQKLNRKYQESSKIYKGQRSNEDSQSKSSIRTSKFGHHGACCTYRWK